MNRTVKIIKADGKKEFELIEQLKQRSREVEDAVVLSVTEIIDQVRQHGDEAIRAYTAKFDKVSLSSFEVPKEALKKAYEACSIRDSLSRAAENIFAYHEKQKQNGYSMTREGVFIGQRVRGLHRVGLYVPGGTAAYPSSVLMNAIPAKVAGVKEIVMITPPAKNGQVDTNILAAAYIAGVDRVFSVGGAQGVAGVCLGTETLPKVDKIVGPGNIYVATAKRLLYGSVDIDMIAGPSEILILADDSAKPRYLAADMLSQAEHDTLASSILLCRSDSQAEKTADELEKQLLLLSRKEIAGQAISGASAIVVCDSVEKQLDLANLFAPEHLELMVKNPFDYLDAVENAGSVFMGENAPEPLGDYFAGPNHVLPTSGTARFFSPLSVDCFVKKSSYIYYTREALEKVSEDVIKIAEAEGLTAHAQSVKVRFENEIR